MTIELPELPYAKDALEPHISARTLSFHHGKHHAGYVKKLKAAIGGTPYAGLDLLTIARQANANGDTKIFNNAAQAWNHGFLWDSMSPDGGGVPGERVAAAIDDAFGSFDEFRKAFIAAGSARFGSGWVWLATSGDRLRVLSTANADLPQLKGAVPLLTCDVWEHAYYLDYQHDRKKYLETYIDHLANWDHAERCLADASSAPIEGEGNYTAARSYRKSAEAFANSGKVAPAARAAADALDGPEGASLKAAESKARVKA